MSMLPTPAPTPSDATRPAEAAAGAAAPAVSKADPPSVASAEGRPAPAVKRTRSRAAAPKPVEPAATQSVPVVETGLSGKRSKTTVSAAAKTSGPAAMPAARKPVRKATASVTSPGDGASGVAAVKVVKAAVAAKTEAPRKRDKLVRDSFTMPKSEYALLGDLKQRATDLARPAKKSELLRAGIKALVAMGDTAFLAALFDVPSLKTGRPAAQDVPQHKARTRKAAERRGS